jgi:hypothetical protein
MSHPPGTGVCQGNFAASVKEILPIHECGALAVMASSGRSAPTIAEDSRHQALDRRFVDGVICFTQAGCPEVFMPQPLDSKGESLRQQGVLNPHPQKVADPLFLRGEFFDPRDLVQVKYEMLRRVRVDKQSVSHSAMAFGFSRPTYYQAEADLQRDGLIGLLPEKRGPHQGHKLTSDVLDLAAQVRASDPSIRAVELAAAIRERFAITAHPRSIERALGRQEKKRR